MKRFLTILFSSVCLYTTAQIRTVNITAQIEHLNSDSILIAYSPLVDPEDVKIDTLSLKNGFLSYKFDANGLYEVTIIPINLIHHFKNGAVYPLPGSRIRFFVNPNDKIDIIAKIEEKNVTYTIKGNRISDQQSARL